MAVAARSDDRYETSLGEAAALAQDGQVFACPMLVPDDGMAGNITPPARLELLNRAAKLALDIVIASVLLVVMAPILLVVVLLIQVESPGTPFYRARRMGYRGQPLDVLKFRKMHHHTRGLPLTLADDARLTRIGAFMARTRIDEIPQLWNVVRCQMSLVGPRPEDPQFVALHADSYRQILNVRPGITGWSQLAFAGETQILDQSNPVGHYIASILPAKVHLDCKYAERTHLRRDFATMMWTAVAMLSRIQVAVHRESGRLGRRRRPATRQSPAAQIATAESTAASRG